MSGQCGEDNAAGRRVCVCVWVSAHARACHQCSSWLTLMSVMTPAHNLLLLLGSPVLGLSQKPFGIPEREIGGNEGDS